MSKLNDKIFTETRLQILEKWSLSFGSMDALADLIQCDPGRPIDRWVEDLKAVEFLEWLGKSNRDIDSICDEAVKVAYRDDKRSQK